MTRDENVSLLRIDFGYWHNRRVTEGMLYRNSGPAWWLHDIGPISVLLALCERKPRRLKDSPKNRAVMRNFDFLWSEHEQPVEQTVEFSLIQSAMTLTWCIAKHSPHKGPIMQKAFPCHDAFITPPWNNVVIMHPLTHILDKMATLSQTIFAYAWSWMKSFVFWLNLYCSFFLNVTITHHWFR